MNTFHDNNIRIYTQLSNIDIGSVTSAAIEFLKNRENSLLDSLNIYGSFIYKKDSVMLAYCDKQLSFSLYVCKNTANISCSYPYKTIATLDEIATTEYKSTKYGYTNSIRTFDDEVLQIPAGHYCTIENNVISINPYTNYIHNDTDSDMSKKTSELDSVYNIMVTKLIKQASEKKILLFISSGKDSVMLLLKLVELGYKNVIACSFGKKYNYEHIFTKKLCNHLGIEYLFLDISYNSEQLDRYIEYHYPKPYAPRYLFVPIVEKLKCDDALFVTGIGGDFLSGKYTHDSKMLNNESNIYILRDNMYNYQTKIRNRHLDVFEYFDVNYFNPYFDNEYVNYWNSVSLDLKINQKLYKCYVDKQFSKIGYKYEPYDKIANIYNMKNEDYYVFNLGTSTLDINVDTKNKYLDYICSKVC